MKHPLTSECQHILIKLIIPLCFLCFTVDLTAQCNNPIDINLVDDFITIDVNPYEATCDCNSYSNCREVTVNFIDDSGANPVQYSCLGITIWGEPDKVTDYIEVVDPATCTELSMIQGNESDYFQLFNPPETGITFLICEGSSTGQTMVNIVSEGCDPCGTNALVSIDDDLHLPNINTDNNNNEVLTIDECGIVAKTDISTLDQDNDATNEIQDISIAGNDLSITNGSTVTIDGDPANEIQDISLAGNDLSITNGSTVTIDGDATNEIQDISIAGNDLSITNGSTVAIDGDPTNEIQDISLSGNDLSISGGSTVTLPSASSSSFEDQDGDTKVEVESSPDIDEVHISLEGTVNYEFKKSNGNAIMDIKNSTNTIIGEGAGASITGSATFSTFVGKNAGNSITTGIQNTFIGENAGANITDRNENVAVGYNALGNSTDARRSVAIGISALRLNDQSYNIGIGRVAGFSCTGNSNTLIGDQCGFQLTTGDDNVLLGRNAGYDMTEGAGNIMIGRDAGPAAANSIIYNSVAIGQDARVSMDNQIVLGNSSVTEIGGFAPWTDYSDGRFKNNVQEDVAGLSFLNKLRPVSYNFDYHMLAEYIGEDSSDETVSENRLSARTVKSNKKQYGFIAQEVYDITKNLNIEFQGVTAPDDTDGVYKMSYASFVVPLVKAVQELSNANDILTEENASLQAQLNSILARLDQLESKSEE